MSTTDTPLTDAVAKAIGRHLADYASRRSEGQRGTLADTAFDIGVEIESIRTLETRLHTAEELLRRAHAIWTRPAPVTSAMNDVMDRIAAHLANATTTKETQT